jgi:hypothetical protein
MLRLLLTLAGLGLALLPLAAGGPALATQRGSCEVPPEFLRDQPHLLELAQRFQAKQPVVIVAIGGASTAGQAAGGDEKSYPRRLEEILRQRHPDVPVTVVNKAVPHQTAQEMVDRFPKDVYPASPTLVIWETGTVDAVRGVDVEEFTDALEGGIAALREHHADVMLVDMQFGRTTTSVINYEPYIRAVQHIADVDDVNLFRRFDIMRYWSETGVFDFTERPKSDRAAMATEVYRCIAEGLADAIDDAIQ